MSGARHLLRISRPRFWLYLGGTYLVGFALGAGSLSELASPVFGVHLLYFLIPANVFLYGVNDLFDEDTDELNPKKGREEHRLQASEKATTRWAVAISGLLGVMLAGLQASGAGAMLMAAFLVLGTAYSVPPARLKARPYLDFLSNVLYAVPGLLGYVHASGHLPPAIAVAAAAAWTGAMHLFSAIPDIEADRSAGLSTTAVVLGQRRSLMVCTALWSAAALGAVALAAGSGILVTALVATAAAVYPVASASLLRRPELVAGTYWRFPALNGLMGFALFVIAMLA